MLMRSLLHRLPPLLLLLGLAAALAGCVAYPDGAYYGYGYPSYGYPAYGYPATVGFGWGWGGWYHGDWGNRDWDGGWHGHGGGRWHH